MKKNLLKRKVQESAPKEPTLESFPDFTKKEIFTQGELINDLLKRYIKTEKINFDYLKIKADKIKRIYIVGSGIDYSCAVFASYNFEVLVDVVSVAVPTSEFIFSNPILDKHTLVILIGNNDLVQKRISNAGSRLVKIVDYSEEKQTIVLGYKTLGKFQTASYTLKLVALSLFALYLGEKNQIITSLYVKIATNMICGIGEKIKQVLSQEFIINSLVSKLDFDNMVVVGTNVDYAVSLYASRVFSLATDKQVTCIPYGEMYLQQKEKSLVALASNIDFYNLIDDKLDYQLKIVSSSVSDLEENTIFYNESIPLLNPILSAVVIQLIAYKKCERG